ncbi:MAG: alkaline phosphatase family protein, partial [Actinobacteria bacterium]|nr:alkaline phosphatase family protein [Actinomycetota bacterium]
MLPTATDNGARLAAILPTGLAALAHGLGADPAESLDRVFGGRTASAGDEDGAPRSVVPETLPALRGFVLIVVDGLGSANLQAAKAHAPTLAALKPRRIETVLPSTTGAALTTLSTGALPGRHGLIGYRIRHPEFGLRNTLKEWHGITDRRSWQLVEPIWPLAE